MFPQSAAPDLQTRQQASAVGLEDEGVCNFGRFGFRGKTIANPAADDTRRFETRGGWWGGGGAARGFKLPDDRSKPGSAAHLLDDSKLRFGVSGARRVETRKARPTVWIAGPFQIFSMSSSQDGCARFIQRTSDTLSVYKCTLDNREDSFTSIMIEPEKSIVVYQTLVMQPLTCAIPFLHCH